MPVKTATTSHSKPTKKRVTRAKPAKRAPKDVFGFDEKKLLAHVESVQAERIRFEKENPDV